MNRRHFILAAAAAGTSLTLPAVAGGTPPSTYPMKTVEALQGTSWVVIDWRDLKAGTIFRLKNDKGFLCDAGNKSEISLAIRDAEASEDPRIGWSVRCEDFTEIVYGRGLA